MLIAERSVERAYDINSASDVSVAAPMQKPLPIAAVVLPTESVYQ